MFAPMSRRLRRLTACILFACTVPLAHATDRSWSPADIALGVTSTTLHIVDWGQTRHISRNPDRWIETNKVLGMHPSVFEVDRYFILYGAAVAALAHAFPEYRRVILAIHIGMHAQAVSSNYSIGIRVNW